MKLFIEEGSKVEDVKKIFTAHYPFLKIELYQKPFVDGHITSKKEPLALITSLNKYIHQFGKASIDIDTTITVSELEKQWENIGLLAEVFRKSGNVWIETTLTNNWTLQQQNAEGEEISRHFAQKRSI